MIPEFILGQVYDEMRLGNYEPLFEWIEIYVPSVIAYKPQMKRLLNEVQDQMAETQASIVLISHEIALLQQLQAELNTLPVTSIRARASKSMALAKQILRIPMLMIGQAEPSEIPTDGQLVPRNTQ